jgi:DNA-binding response OmpR family regulator
MFSSSLTGLVSDRAHVPDVAQAGAWPTLLVVDPDPDFRGTLVCFLEKRGFHVAAGGNVADVKEFIHRRKNWTLIITDCHLPDGTGPELSDWLQSQGCDAPVLLMSNHPRAAALFAGLDCLPKPFPMEKLEGYIRGLRRA